jgi:iron complex outermembrane receptor protein
MKTISVTILFLFSFCGVFSQTSLSGRIVDSMSAPVPYSIVALLHSGDSALVQGKITDADGVYTFENIKPGNYFLKVSATGFATKFSSGLIKDSLSDLNVADFSLEKVLLLDAVTISSVTPTIEFKSGNITVNVEDSPLARGNSVYDLLSKLPGVSVENNTITLMGKSGVVIMIDGRIQQMSNEQLMNVLKSMSAATIRKIEVLKNPPVKYDAAGTSGMINIVTKKSEQRGFNGTIYNETSQGFYNNTSSGIALNYKNEKISIFSGVDGVYDTYLVNTKLYTNFVSDSGHTQFSNLTSYKAPDHEITYKLGADWFVNESNIIGFKIDGGPGIYDESGYGANHVTGYNNTGFDHLIFRETGHNKWATRNYNLNAEHKFDTTGTVLDFSVDFTDDNETDHSLYSSYYYDTNENEVAAPNIYQNTNTSPTKIISSKIDFMHPIDTSASVEAGIKGSNTNMTNDYLFERKNNLIGNFYRDSILSNTYFYSEQNLAVYFNYSKSFRHLSLQAGIRGENTTAKSRNTANSFRLSKNYFSLFPDVSFQYSKSEDHVFEINVNRRIDRPSYWDLTPFIVYRDPYSYFSGNPNLQPHFSNTAEFTYSFKGIVNASISYSRINHFMLDYTEQYDSTKVLLETSKNINYQHSLAYLLLIKYDFTDWYEMLFNGTVTYEEYKGDILGIPFKTNGLNYTMNLTNTFLLPKKAKLEISALYRGPNLFGITKINPVGMVSFAVQKSFLKEKLNCSIGMNDIFNTMHFHTHAQFDNQDWNFYQGSDTRRISFSISYNFGKIKTDERELNSNEEEKGRLNH